MNKIIPTIFALNENQFETKLEILKKFSKTIHLDFCDNTFTSSKTIKLNQMSNILKEKKIDFETHLMAKNPLKYLDELKQLQIKEIFIHQEIFKSLEEFEKTKKEFEKNDIQTNLVINPQTQIESIILFISHIKKIMLMSVVPGAEGQEFIEETYEKIKQLKILKPNLIIQVDGGITNKNSKKLFKLGANNLCIGSFISSSKNPQKNFEKLKSNN